MSKRMQLQSLKIVRCRIKLIGQTLNHKLFTKKRCVKRSLLSISNMNLTTLFLTGTNCKHQWSVGQLPPSTKDNVNKCTGSQTLNMFPGSQHRTSTKTINQPLAKTSPFSEGRTGNLHNGLIRCKRRNLSLFHLSKVLLETICDTKFSFLLMNYTIIQFICL